MMHDGSVPTVTVGGFLGAGKTTLVNHLLRQANGARVVVFVNDFGAINIDYDLIETVEEDRIALSNGCVCCTLNDDLIRTMVDFCESDPPDLFVIEASGVADPKSLNATIEALHRSGRVHMQRRVYLIDAEQFDTLDYADTEDLIDYAAACDLIAINKADLVSEQRLHEISRLLSRSAPKSASMTASYGRVPFEALLQDPDAQQAPERASSGGGDGHARFKTLAFENIPPLTPERLDALEEALETGCLRAKGFLHLEGSIRSTVRIQSVGRRYEAVPLPAEEARQARLVTIWWAKAAVPLLLVDLLGVEPVVA